MYNYRTYGLTIQSPFEIPQLLPSQDEPDVVIETGSVPEHLEDIKSEGICYQINDSQYLLKLDHIARYLVTGGDSIIVDPDENIDDDSMQLFLLSSVMGALFHQRGILPLHGSAIATPKGAVIFTGSSGIGKSINAEVFRQRGYKILADDVTVVSVNDHGKAVASPAAPVLQLWQDTLKRFDWDRDAYKKIRPGLKKYEIPIADDLFPTELQVHAVYLLSTINTDEMSLTPITGLQKFNLIKRQTYRLRYLDGMPSVNQYFDTAMTLAQTAKVARIVRPRYPFKLRDLADMLEEDFTQ